MTKTVPRLAVAMLAVFPLLTSLLSFCEPAQAQGSSKVDDSFPAWWRQFQAAVAKGDAKAAAQAGEFPMNWENHTIRSIASQEDFEKRFASYFTARIKQAVRQGRPERLPNGNFILTWHADGNEYSLYFKPWGTSFALDGLSEGPP